MGKHNIKSNKTWDEMLSIADRFSNSMEKISVVTAGLDGKAHTSLQDVYELAFTMQTGSMYIESIAKYKNELSVEAQAAKASELELLDATQQSVGEAVSTLRQSIEKALRLYKPQVDAMVWGQDAIEYTMAAHGHSWSCRNDKISSNILSITATVASETHDCGRKHILALLPKATLALSVVMAVMIGLPNKLFAWILDKTIHVAQISESAVVTNVQAVMGVLVTILLYVFATVLICRLLADCLYITLPMMRPMLDNAASEDAKTEEGTSTRLTPASIPIMLNTIINRIADGVCKVDGATDGWRLAKLVEVKSYTAESNLTIKHLIELVNIELAADIINSNLGNIAEADTALKIKELLGT